METVGQILYELVDKNNICPWNIFKQIVFKRHFP